MSEETSQDKLKNFVLDFFKIESNYTRLRNLINHDPAIFNISFFFVTKYSPLSLYNINSIPRSLNDLYKSALRGYKKCYFDFESEPGKGEVVMNGEVNPAIDVNETYGDLKCTLPRLMALRWMIHNRIDELMLNNFANIKQAYVDYVTERRECYSERHKDKLKTIRQRVEEEVVNEERLSNKDSSSVGLSTDSSNPAKKQRTRHLSQPQRKIVNARIAQEIHRQKQEREKEKNKIKKSSSKNVLKPAVEVARSINGLVTEI